MSARLIIIILLSGLLLCCGVAIGWIGKTFQQGFASWGKAEVLFDEEAKSRIIECSLTPSPEAHDFYYYIDGFEDHRVFCSYLDTDDKIQESAAKLAGKPVTEWYHWDGSKASTPAPMPGTEDKSLRSPFYDPPTITKGCRFESMNEAGGWEVIVDLDRHRLLYYFWNT